MNREQQERFMGIVHEAHRRIKELESELDDTEEVGQLTNFRDHMFQSAADLTSRFVVFEIFKQLKKGDKE